VTFLRLLSGFAFLFSCSLAGEQYPVFQAQPGAVPQRQNVPIPSQDNNQNPQLGATSLNDMANMPMVEKTNNEFLQFYTRQGSEFSATVYYQQGQSLVKRNISQDKLEKGIVIFFGDWCPHCENFLKTFSSSIEPLRKYGIHITFVNIPSIDRLRNWQEPTLDEFNAAENKISSYGISLTKGVEVAILGDVSTLSKTGIDGLPVFIALKNGKERYRGVGENCSAKLNFNNLDILMNFLDIWDHKAIKEQKEASSSSTDRFYKSKELSKRKSKRKIYSKKAGKKSVSSKVDLAGARAATAFLNGNGVLGFNLNFYK
jgi:thiol-disulfide isomerase/thioredoxin